MRRHLAQRRNLYAKAVSAGDVRTALAVLDSEAKMLRLFPTPEDALPGKSRRCRKCWRSRIMALATLRAEVDRLRGQVQARAAAAPSARPAAVGGVGGEVPDGEN